MSDLTDMADAIALDFNMAVRTYGRNTARSLQSQAGIIGPSDLGFCRNKANLMMQGVEETDAKPIWPAQVGTAVHTYVGAALREAHPEWIIDDTRVTATFPSGATVSGTPDVMGVMTVIGPKWFAVLDVKTKDGLAEPRRHGANQNHRYQRHTYALGAMQGGHVPKGKKLLVGNIYVDRSGQEDKAIVDLEEFDPVLTQQIDDWIQDVIYARTHGEDASRDVPAPVCERICEYFTVCRGGLPMSSAEPIHDPEFLNAIALYNDGKAMEKAGKTMKKDGAALLYGINGFGGGFQVRWIEVPESVIAETARRSYMRIDVRKVRT